MQKFKDVDILKSMETIVNIHTKHYQSDFAIDKQILAQAAMSCNAADKSFIWLCRTCGTWCLNERNVFIKDTREHNTFCYYADNTDDNILSYIIELNNLEKDRIVGNIVYLGYHEYYKHVKAISVPSGGTKMVYEHGERIEETFSPLSKGSDPEFGKLLSFESLPKDTAALIQVLRDEKHRRDHARCYSLSKHFKRLVEAEKHCQ